MTFDINRLRMLSAEVRAALKNTTQGQWMQAHHVGMPKAIATREKPMLSLLGLNKDGHPVFATEGDANFVILAHALAKDLCAAAEAIVDERLRVTNLLLALADAQPDQASKYQVRQTILSAIGGEPAPPPMAEHLRFCAYEVERLDTLMRAVLASKTIAKAHKIAARAIEVSEERVKKHGFLTWAEQIIARWTAPPKEDGAAEQAIARDAEEAARAVERLIDTCRRITWNGWAAELALVAKVIHRLQKRASEIDR